MTQEEYDRWYFKKILLLMVFCLVGAGFCLFTFGVSLYSLLGSAFVIVVCSLAGKIGNPPEPEPP
jgi:hypothetical protein